MSDERGLTPRQRIMLYLQFWLEAHAYGPTLRELASGVGMARNSVDWHLTVLERQGYVRRRNFAARTLELLIPIAFVHPEAPVRARKEVTA